MLDWEVNPPRTWHTSMMWRRGHRHTGIKFRGEDHCQMYKGSELVWSKHRHRCGPYVPWEFREPVAGDRVSVPLWGKTTDEQGCILYVNPDAAITASCGGAYVTSFNKGQVDRWIQRYHYEVMVAGPSIRYGMFSLYWAYRGRIIFDYRNKEECTCAPITEIEPGIWYASVYMPYYGSTYGTIGGEDIFDVRDYYQMTLHGWPVSLDYYHTMPARWQYMSDREFFDALGAPCAPRMLDYIHSAGF